MSDTIEKLGRIWGAIIPVDNNRIKPDWLGDEDMTLCGWGGEEPYMDVPAHCIHGFSDGFRLRLLADHPHYAALAAEADPYGPEIAVDGLRPAWLSDNDICLYQQSENWLPNATNPNGYIWSAFSAIRLPRDHFAYTAIDKGFGPWGGGDDAPGDWDGGPVLYRCGDDHV